MSFQDGFEQFRAEVLSRPKFVEREIRERFAFSVLHLALALTNKKDTRWVSFLLVEEDGFEPSKQSQQIYSLPPLATRELFHIKFSVEVELVDGLEPPTC